MVIVGPTFRIEKYIIAVEKRNLKFIICHNIFLLTNPIDYDDISC
jgi:hypothetical protein